MKDKYTTNDPFLVAALLTYGIIHTEIEVKGDQKWFSYEKTPDVMTAVVNHFAGTLNVPSLQMKANYREILAIVKQK